MKPSFMLRLALGVWAAMTLTATAQVQKGGPPVRYRLTQESQLSYALDTGGVPGERQTSRLRGTLELSKQISPLDWDYFQVSNLRLSAPGIAPEGLRVLGEGVYSVGGRTKIVQRMTLTVSLGGRAVELASGDVAPVQAWPTLDIEVKGQVVESQPPKPITRSYTLHLVAVPELARWHYEVLPGSTLLDDCPVCLRPSIPEPLRGGFDLVLVDQNPLFTVCHVFDLHLVSTLAGEVRHELAGEGSYTVGGEVAVRQTLTLAVEAVGPAGKSSKTFTNDTPAVERPWPMLKTTATEEQGTLVSTLHLDLQAAPLRELWFTTGHGLTSGKSKPPGNHVAAGSLLSLAGRVVVPNAELGGHLGLMPTVGDLAVDAVTIGPGGAVLFSLQADVFSETLGGLGHGDWLSAAGRVVTRNAGLLAPFGLMLPAPDVGLDAAQVLDDGDMLFSTRQDAFSELKGILLGHGDILSSRGARQKTNQELLAAFHPPDARHDYGLDAFYVWPHGEVWFSTEEGFNDKVLGPVTHGDLLSDQGYIIVHNLDLVGAFAPLEDLANFGLSSLFIVTDLTPPAAAPRLTSTGKSPTGGWTLRWQGPGRVFQVERSSAIGDDFVPASPLLPALEWTAGDPVPATRAGFYRLRQW